MEAQHIPGETYLDAEVRARRIEDINNNDPFGLNVLELIEENARLKESNKVLLEALSELTTSVYSWWNIAGAVRPPEEFSKPIRRNLHKSLSIINQAKGGE